MRVALFVTCLVDRFWPEVGVACVEVLRRAGCEVHFDERQTCCGQPAHNTGYAEEARRVGRHVVETYASDDREAIVVPSGSCAAMFRHLPELFDEDDPDRARAAAVAERTFELSSFLVDVLGVTELGAEFEGRLLWHDACHGLRELGVRDQPRTLLRNVGGVELVEPDGPPSCCGFGGTFAVKQPELSVAMVDERLCAFERTGAQWIVSSDVSCLMQIGGRAERQRSEMGTLHLAQVLASRR